MIREALFSYLTGLPAISQLVGMNVFPMIIPEGREAPAITYQRTTVDRQARFCGTSNLVRSEFILNSFAKKTGEAAQIAKAARDALIDYNGMMGSVSVSIIRMDSEVDSIDEEPGLFQVSQSYSIWHEE